MGVPPKLEILPLPTFFLRYRVARHVVPFYIDCCHHPGNHLVLRKFNKVLPAITYTYVHRLCLTQINIKPWG